MKRLLFFCLLAFSSQAQLLNTYYPVYESNRKKGNGKLFYRLYSLSTSVVFPNTETELDNTFTTYGTYQAQGTTTLAVNVGTTNSSSSSTRNILNFSNTSDFTSSINNSTPYAGFTGEQYALMISGYFIPKQTGTYKFSIEGDDSVEIMINGTNVANHYGGHGASAIGTHTGTISLIAGKKYSLRIRFMENAAGDALFLYWQKPSETGGTTWYQDIEELSSEEVIPNGLVMNVDPSNLYTYPKTGTTVRDLTGNMVGTVGGNMSYNASIAAGVFTSDGSGDYINFGSNPTNFPASGDISAFLWVRPTSLNNGWNIFMSKWFTDLIGNGGYADFHFAFYPISGTLYQNLYTTNRYNAFGSTPVTINNWYNVGFTISNGNLQFYLNGALDGSVQSNSARTNQTVNMFWVGDARSGVGGFIGNIGSALIYNRALSHEEVIQNFNATKSKYGL
jgi:Concanavalin A-like lectin/glucanases superfamily/PA14 domain